MKQDSVPSPSRTGLLANDFFEAPESRRLYLVRRATSSTLKTHTRLLTGRCACGARADDTWSYREHLADVIAEEVLKLL